MDSKWTEALKIYGPLGLFTALLLAFLYREIWSLLKKKLENADKQALDFQKQIREQGEMFAGELREQREAFLKAINTIEASYKREGSTPRRPK